VSLEPSPLETIPAPRPRRVRIPFPPRRPYVVYGLLGITIFIFLLQIFTSNGSLDLGLRCPFFNTLDIPACYGLKVNELIIQGQWWRLIAPVLLHASLMHIGFNMYALFAIGPELEQHFGHWGFLALYMLGGFAGVVLSFLLTTAPSLGASTAVFGLLGAQAVFAYRNQRVFGPQAKAALRSILNIAVINFIIGLTPGIDNWGHFGGLLGGLLFAGFAVPIYSVVESDTDARIVNKTPPSRAWLGAVAVLVIFGALALQKIL
jgi:rhomboid protease GluP